MDTLTQGSLRKVAASEADVCISIYLPLERTYPQANENPRRLAAALDEAVEILCTQHSFCSAGAEKLVNESRDFVERRDFWQASDANGLAVLIASNAGGPETTNYWLPYSVSASVDVGSRFHLAPLVRLLDFGVDFELLALVLNHVRLFAGTRKSLIPAPLPPGVPESFDAYMKGTEVGRPVQFRASAARGSGGDQVVLVHGQTSCKDDHKLRVQEFVSHIGKQIAARLKDSGVPLVLAAVDSYMPVFRDACRLDNLIAEGVSGSPDELSEQQLHQQAVQAVEGWNAQRLASFQGAYQTRLADGRASH